MFPYQDPRLPVEQRVNDLLARMTLREKILQTDQYFSGDFTTQDETGRVTRLDMDRLDALHYAIDHAQEGDLIAVIGKGHEAYRDREGVKTPFLERELIEEYAAEKGIE